MNSPASTATPLCRVLLVNCLLAFVVGYVDVVGFVATAGLFTAHGRLVRMAPALATFTLGALAGAVGYAATSFWCLLAPIGALAALVGTTPGRRLR